MKIANSKSQEKSVNAYADSVSVTLGNLFLEHEQPNQHADQSQPNDAHSCAVQWNSLLETIGSFADDHITL